MKKDIISKELLKEMAKDISRHILHIEILDDMELIDNEFTRVERRDADLVYKNGNEIVRDEINYKYAIIDIRDIPCESFLQSDDPSAVVLAILCDFEGKDKQMIVNTILKRLIELSDDEVCFRNYLEKVEVFSTNRNLEKYVDKGETMLTVDIEKLPSFNRGLKKGIHQGVFETAIVMIKDFQLAIDDVAQKLNIKKEELLAYMKEKES